MIHQSRTIYLIPLLYPAFNEEYPATRSLSLVRVRRQKNYTPPTLRRKYPRQKPGLAGCCSQSCFPVCVILQFLVYGVCLLLSVRMIPQLRRKQKYIPICCFSCGLCVFVGPIFVVCSALGVCDGWMQAEYDGTMIPPPASRGETGTGGLRNGVWVEDLGIKTEGYVCG